VRKLRAPFHRRSDLIRYWEQRARAHGRRAVLNISYSDEEYEAVTRMQERELFPHLRAALHGSEEVVLDLGCGPGRFTPSLASIIGGTAVGVDPIQAFLDAAPWSPFVEYRRSSGRDIPMPDASVDVVWCCLVLGGIRDLDQTVSEIRRVARPGCLLFVVENTTETDDRAHWFYRSVAEYQRAFGVPLRHVHDYEDQGERISVMVGRL
jgi:ubiquinone/menaquinone biosynthesis C-methylase UbiE